MDAHSTLRWRLAALAAVAPCACGGGGPAPAPTASAPPRPVEQSDLQIAQSVYGTGPRTPAGFYSDPQPSGYGYVSTMHVKNASVDATVAARAALRAVHRRLEPGARVVRAQRTARAAVFDLVETNDDPRYFEFGRVPRGDPTFYVRRASSSARTSIARTPTCEIAPVRRVN